MFKQNSWLIGMMMIFAFSTIAIPNSALAQSFGGPRKGMGEGPGMERGFGFGSFLTGPMLAKMAQTVGLTKDETKKIQDIVYAAERENIPVIAKISEARLNLKQKMDADTAPSEKEVSALIDTMGKAETQLKKGHIMAMLRIRKTVSMEKWKKMEAMVMDVRMQHRGMGRMMEEKGKKGPK